MNDINIIHEIIHEDCVDSENSHVISKTHMNIRKST